MSDIEFLDLDIHSTDGAALLAAVRKRHGDDIVHAASLLDRLFLLRSPWAPGLRCVGGEITGSANNNTQQFSLIGASLQLEDAFASCVAEGIERVSCIERPGDAFLLDHLPDIMPAARDFIDTRLLPGKSSSALPDTPWMRAQILPFGNTFLPADWCLRRSGYSPLRIPGAALSTGVAAGPTPVEATERALLELVERDAAGLWWSGGARGRHVAVDSVEGAEAGRLLSALRDGFDIRRTWLLDITTDLNIPCIAALSTNPDGTRLCCGLGARMTKPDAVRAAVLEMCQSELGLLLALVKQATGEGTLTQTDRRHIARASLDANRCDLLHPAGISPPGSGGEDDPSQDRLARLIEKLSKAGIEVATVDHTRPEFNIPVIRAIAPQLQQMPCDVVVERLEAIRQVTGGGARWIREAPLI